MLVFEVSLVIDEQLFSLFNVSGCSDRAELPIRRFNQAMQRLTQKSVCILDDHIRIFAMAYE